MMTFFTDHLSVEMVNLLCLAGLLLAFLTLFGKAKDKRVKILMNNWNRLEKIRKEIVALEDKKSLLIDEINDRAEKMFERLNAFENKRREMIEYHQEQLENTSLKEDLIAMEILHEIFIMDIRKTCALVQKISEVENEKSKQFRINILKDYFK